MIGLLMFPQTGSAKTIPLSENQLSEVYGQAGFAEDTTTIINSQIDNMSTMNGLMTLSDVNIQGSIVNRAPSTTNTNIAYATVPGFGMMGLGSMGLGSMGLGTHLINTTININLFSIGAIRVGNDTNGPSLGSFAISGLHADIQGTVSITAH
jgi:hypothetical protein